MLLDFFIIREHYCDDLKQWFFSQLLYMQTYLYTSTQSLINWLLTVQYCKAEEWIIKSSSK